MGRLMSMIEFVPQYWEGLKRLTLLWLIIFGALIITALTEAIDEKWEKRGR